MPAIPGIINDGVITSEDALSFEKLPESIVIIGAGAIGLEFATFFNSFGIEVTVVELKKSILPEEDEDISSALLRIMKRRGIKFRLSAKVTGINKSSDKLQTTIDESGTLVSPVVSKSSACCRKET